ncbi:TRAP transporter substrate-binding protein DctP [Pikeienuella sp. HZG-20]|uniref:TRAP transporter substrate-binding protein DctP n=1 Tax=Paludibacillus litoralis TaxID=3133267 RepID=UPI0030ECD704
MLRQFSITRQKTSRAAGKLKSALFASAFIIGGAGASNAADYTMAIAHILPEAMSNEVQVSLVHFKSLVESATEGGIEVQIFGAMQLGSEVETGKQAQDGALLQSTVISSGAMSSFYPKYQAITAPFLFPSYRVAHAFLDGAWFADFMSDSAEESGLRYLGTFDDGGGFVAFTNNKRLIKTADDIKGLKIRVEENPAHVTVMKALGASATPLPWGEVVTALATGLADGQFNAPGVSENFKLWEVNDYTTLSGHIYNTQTWVVSEKWFQSLPEDYQAIVIHAAQEAIGIGHGIASLAAIAGWQTSCKEFKECYVLPTSERQAMADIARPAWREWITTDFGLDGQIIDDMLAEVTKIGADIDAEDMRRYGR